MASRFHLLASAAISVVVLVAAAAPTAWSRSALTKDDEEFFARQDRLANQMMTQAKQVVASLEPKLKEIRTRSEQEFAGLPVVPDVPACWKDLLQCPGGSTVILSTPPRPGQCEPLKSIKPLPPQKFDLAELDRLFDLRVKDFHTVQSHMETTAKVWADNRSRLRAKWTTYREKFGAQIPPSFGSIQEMMREENQFYAYVYGTVVWEASLIWELELREVIGINAPDSNSVGFMELVKEGSRINVSEAYHNLQIATCLSGVADWNWANAGTGTEAEANRTARAEQKEWLKCRQAEDRERDRVAPLVRQMRDLLINERTALREIAGQWRKFTITNHIYVGEGPTLISAVYGDDDDMKLFYSPRLPSAGNAGIPYTEGNGGSTELNYNERSINSYAGVEAKAEIQLPDDCQTGHQILLNGEPEWASAKIRFPDVETEPFLMSLDLVRPLVEEGVISGASDTERP